MVQSTISNLWYPTLHTLVSAKRWNLQVYRGMRAVETIGTLLSQYVYF